MKFIMIIMIICYNASFLKVDFGVILVSCHFLSNEVFYVFPFLWVACFKNNCNLFLG